MKTAEGAKLPKLVPAVERASAILDMVAGSAVPPTLAEIARVLSLPKSSAHGLCQTLCHLGLLSETYGRFSLGGHIFEWAHALSRSSDLVAEFHRILRETPEIIAHTVTLSRLEGDDVVYLACHNANTPLGVTFRIGMRLPAAFTATGKAILAALPAGDAALAVPLPPPMTPFSVTDHAALLRELQETRERGFSIDNGQIRSGMFCLGAAILDAERRPVAGVALSLTDAEATARLTADLGARVAAIAKQLGGFAASALI